MKYNGHKYTMTPRHDWIIHNWVVHCVEGAVELNVQLHKEGKYDPACGLEFHSRTPVRNEAPAHVDCHVLKCPCWHDGTSMYATTLWEDYGLRRLCENGQHDAILSQLEIEIERHWRKIDDD